MRILLSGGGTAGHINPAVAIAGYALRKDKNTQVLFVGTKKGLEKDLIPKEGYDIKFVNVSGLKKEISVESMVSATKLGLAVVKSIGILKSFKPDVVVGTGGYVCVSSVIAAKLLGIPSIIHEQNVFPGSAVKFLAGKSDVTAISFEESTKYINGAKRICLTGNPIRPSITEHGAVESKKELGLEGKKVILAFGGSLGAARINDVITDYLESYTLGEDTVLYFGTGAREYNRVMAEIERRNIKTDSNVKILPYIDNMDVLMNAADVVICRSGAITLAEICALGKASILVPSPNVTNDHQTYNARALSDKGAAITITEDEFNPASLNKALTDIFKKAQYADGIRKKALQMGITDATDKIYNLITELTGGK